jgi:gliding motility-associated protein GldC
MQMNMAKKDFIKLEITLGENKIPESIDWTASGNQDGRKKEEAKAFFLALFDRESRDTMQMDLWTREMQVIEMDRFVFQTLGALSDLYFRSTKNVELANEMKKFMQYFGQQTQILNTPK